MLLSHLLRHIVREGTLRVYDAAGSLHVFAGKPGRTVTVRLHDSAAEFQLFFNSQLKLGECFMDGRLTIEDGSIYDLLDFLSENLNSRAAAHHDAIGRTDRPPVPRVRAI